MRATILMIAVLLNSLNNSVSGNEHFPIGDNNEPDSIRADSLVDIDIRYIRAANTKLIERLYLIRISHAQDSIITLKQDYINEQNRIIDDMQDRILAQNKVNLNLRERNDRLSKRKKFWKFLGIGSAIGLGAVLIYK